MNLDRRSFLKILSRFKLMPIVSNYSFSQSITTIKTVAPKTTLASAHKDNQLRNVCFKKQLQQIHKLFPNIIFEKLRHLHFSNMRTKEIGLSRTVAFRKKSTTYLNDTLQAKSNDCIQWSEGFDFFSQNKVEGTQLPDYEIIHQN